MKRHLTLSNARQHARNQGDTAETVADRARATSLSDPARARPYLTHASASVWRHRLILTGRLDYRSAPELEEEIECLFQEGVTILTLDLRQLEAIDSTGAMVIAYHNAICKRRGHELAVISGSRVIHRALAEAGATDSLTPEPTESVVRHFSSSSSDGAFSDRSTTMIKTLSPAGDMQGHRFVPGLESTR
jgi:anti-anti-sigma factor